VTLPSFPQHAAALAAGRFVRVVNYHNTPASLEAELEADLRGYLGAYDPVTPGDLDAFLDTGRWPTARPGFVAAFYDGYRNHATVAAPVCDRLGVTAWFLPPTGFLATPAAQQQAFADAHDMWVLEEELAQDRLAMTFDELAAIAERHVVIAHTATHAAAETTVAAADLDREVAGPRKDLERVTGQAPPGLVWRLGGPYDPEHPSGKAAREAGYRFVLSNTAIQRIAPP
jgi:peptidoglycan/xylan/chitin deacetylase (PgdA/CDA1 family)